MLYGVNQMSGMIGSKVTYITPIGNQALIGIVPIQIGEDLIQSIPCRNWRGLSIGDTVTIKLVAGIPMIISNAETDL